VIRRSARSRSTTHCACPAVRSIAIVCPRSKHSTSLAPMMRTQAVERDDSKQKLPLEVPHSKPVNFAIDPSCRYALSMNIKVQRVGSIWHGTIDGRPDVDAREASRKKSRAGRSKPWRRPSRKRMMS
jgi:hypothetical protein